LHRAKAVRKGAAPVAIMSASLPAPIPWNTLPLISLSLGVNDWMLHKVLARENQAMTEATKLLRARKLFSSVFHLSISPFR
jgi:hypothetical protein